MSFKYIFHQEDHNLLQKSVFHSFSVVTVCSSLLPKFEICLVILRDDLKIQFYLPRKEKKIDTVNVLCQLLTNESTSQTYQNDDTY